jgi:hypothetical protein
MPAAKASAEVLVNGERSWVIPELEFFSDKGVAGYYAGGKTLADIKVVCTTVAWMTEIDVRMEIGLIPRLNPDFTPSGHEISLQYEPAFSRRQIQ